MCRFINIDTRTQRLRERHPDRNIETPGHTYTGSQKFRDMQNLGMHKDRNTQILEHRGSWVP